VSVEVDPTRCQGCGLCAEMCPAGAIRVDSVAHVDSTACLDCGACVDECPTGALAMEEADPKKESVEFPVPGGSYEAPPVAGSAFRAVDYVGFPPAGAPVGWRGRGGAAGRGRRMASFSRRGGRGRGRGGGRWRQKRDARQRLSSALS
jgi:ferredoxin